MSALAGRILEPVRALEARSHAGVTLVRVVPVAGAGLEDDAGRDLRDVARAELESAEAALSKEGLRGESCVLAHEKRVGRWTFGSIAETVVKQCPVPTLAQRPGGTPDLIAPG